jgi:5'-methylthioadenosine nucleosidase
VAYVADMLRVPLILLKAVTDIVDGDRATTEEFLENLSTAANALQNVIPKLFDHLST